MPNLVCTARSFGGTAGRAGGRRGGRQRRDHLVMALDATAPDLWLKRPVPSAAQIGEAELAGSDATGGRSIAEVTLTAPDGDPMVAIVSRPLDDERRLPVIILIGGFDTGVRSVDRLSDPGSNVVIGYGYPDAGLLKAHGQTIRKLVMAQRDAYRVPGQIAALAAWAAAQPWAEFPPDHLGRRQLGRRPCASRGASDVDG